MIRSGFTQVFRFRGVPVRLHWSVVFIAFFIGGGFRLAVGAWTAYLLLILIHEMGHAMLAQRYGLRVLRIDVHGLGGLCAYEGTDSQWQRSVIAWGGVLGQLVFLLLALPLARFEVLPPGLFVADFLRVAISVNLFIVALNLIPLRGLDGAQAWKLPRLWWKRRRQAKYRRGLERAEAAKARAQALAPHVRVVRKGDDFQVEIDDLVE